MKLSKTVLQDTASSSKTVLKDTASSSKTVLKTPSVAAKLYLGCEKVTHSKKKSSPGIELGSRNHPQRYHPKTLKHTRTYTNLYKTTQKAQNLNL